MTHVVKVRNMMRLIAATSAALMAMSAGQAFASVNIDSSITETGPESSTEVNTDHNENVDVEVRNDTEFNTDGDIELITGENVIEYVTEADDNETGDAEVEIVLDNTANDGTVRLPDGLGDVDIDSEISKTGPYSATEINNDVNKEVTVDIRNDAEVNTDLDVNLVTGRNSITDTTEAGQLSTGNASFEFKGTNNLNSGGGNVDLGNLGGNVDLSSSIEKTGPYSATEINNDVNQIYDVNVRNNATVNTNFDIDANTGDNSVEDVTDFGGLHTGDAKVKIELNNQAN